MPRFAFFSEHRRLSARGAALLLATAGALAHAQVPAPFTVEAVGSHGRLTDGQPQAHAFNLRGTWVAEGGHVARAELLDETKFGSRGGIVALGYTRVLSPDWVLAGTVAAGHGGPNWANARGDLEVSKAWFESRWLVTRAAAYRATFDGQRSDTGVRLSVVSYVPAGVVLEGGLISNVSDPGRVSSVMYFASATLGREGQQYFSVRASDGKEAYQALGAGQQLVGFRSRSLGLNWRRWLGDRWGFSAQAEHYRNPSYERNTFGAGLFVQW